LSYLYKSKYFAATYAVNIDDAEMSEKHWQEVALSFFKTEKLARTINISKSDFEIDNLRNMLVNSDVPFFHPSFVGSTRMALEAFNDGVKVLMSGEGADEIFLGYRWFIEEEPVNSIFEYVPLNKLSRFLGVNEPDIGFLNEIDRLEFFQRFYLQRWLARSDLTGMRHSVEVRVPFLDMDLVDALNHICRAYKIKYGAKWILKNQLLKSLPYDFVNRRKRGFDFPLNSWMHDSQIDFLRDNKNIFEVGDKEITELHKSCDYRDKRLIFSMCSFALWLGC
jgi:asparagine synthase (glutamine-hydrolysing)